MAKIDSKIKQEIKERALAGEAHRKLAKEYGIGAGSISRIRNEEPAYMDRIETGATADIFPIDIKPTSVGIVSGDWQVPYHDPVALGLFFDFCKREQPNWIDINGDLCDFYQISRFNKDPNRIADLQGDINMTVGFLRRLRRENPNAIIYYEEGNHEKRLKKALWNDTGKFASLECLRLESLMCLNELGIVFVEKWRQQGDLYITHGTLVRKHAGYTAKATFEKYGVTMIINHTHRDGKFTRRTLDGHKAVWENYCLCTLDPEWTDFADWTQGFSKVTMIDNRPYVEQVPIIAGEYIYGGQRYGGRTSI